MKEYVYTRGQFLNKSRFKGVILSFLSSILNMSPHMLVVSFVLEFFANYVY